MTTLFVSLACLVFWAFAAWLVLYVTGWRFDWSLWRRPRTPGPFLFVRYTGGMSARPKEDQNSWNVAFSVFFIAVLAASVWAVHAVRGGYPVAVPFIDLVLMAFATLRVTRLVVYDKIARWFRELFARRREFDRDGVTYVEIVPYESGMRHTLWDLVQCPWCIGIWSALIVTVSYFMFPWAWLVIVFLALAGASSLLQVAANGMGWWAENLKAEAGERNRDLRL